MKKMLRDIWQCDRQGSLSILFLNIAVSMTGGISILMLIPMLGLLDAFSFALPFSQMPYTVKVLIMIGIYLLLVITKALLNRKLTLRETRFLEDYSFNLREALYKGVSGAEWEKLAAGRQTDTIQLFTAQCGQVSYGAGETIRLLSMSVSMAVQLAIALWLSLPVTALVIILGGGFAFLFRNLLKQSKNYGEELIRVNRAMYSELGNQLRGVKEVRTYNVRREHADLFLNISESFRQAKMKYAELYAFPQMVYTIAAAGMIAFVFIACVLVFKMETARLMVLVYVFVRLWPIFSGLYGRMQNIQTCVPAYEKLQEAFTNLNTTQIEDAPREPLTFKRDIIFENVSFSYRGSQEAVLKNVSFTLKKGSVTALVGRSGAGKTTIADLLLGFLRPTSGQILIDGVPLTKENLVAWRHALGYVPQEPLILNACVKENLKRFHPSATDEELIEALKKAQAWDFVSTLEKGLDTVLGDQGVRLSGGERQRIVLARVLLGHPRLIIMDEATSAMDYESETAVRQAIMDFSKETTILIIAHRLATVRAAQFAIVLENGAVREEGKLSDLMDRLDGYLHKLLYIE